MMSFHDFRITHQDLEKQHHAPTSAGKACLQFLSQEAKLRMPTSVRKCSRIFCISTLRRSASTLTHFSTCQICSSGMPSELSAMVLPQGQFASDRLPVVRDGFQSSNSAS